MSFIGILKGFQVGIALGFYKESFGNSMGSLQGLYWDSIAIRWGFYKGSIGHSMDSYKDSKWIL